MKKSSMIKNNNAIVEGGIYVIFTCILAMIVLLIFLPIIASLLPNLIAMDNSGGRFDAMTARLGTSINLFYILPIFMVIISIIFFVMRTIRKQSYSRYQDDVYR